MGFTDLILLIGTNPLPNFATAKYFIEVNHELKKIHLIYSDKTELSSSTLVYADKIQGLLGNGEIEFKRICLKNIENSTEINYNLSQIKPGSEDTLHLNFTGGTKVMGIFAFNYISGLENIKSYSYLSPRTFSLTNELGDPISRDLRDEIKTSIEEVINLHDFEIIPPKKTESPSEESKKTENPSEESKKTENPFEEADKEFYGIMNEGNLSGYYNKDKGGYGRELFHDENGHRITKKDGLKKHIKYRNTLNLFRDILRNQEISVEDKEKFFKEIFNYDFAIGGELLNVNNKIPDNYRLFDTNGELKDVLPKTDNIEKTIKYMDGFWFENYCLNIISELTKKLRNSELRKNISITKKEWEKEEDRKKESSKDEGWKKNVSKFEIDGILKHGYQFFGISITTEEEKGLCKLKGFEIINRITQIGGDEAKAILITMLRNDIKSELNMELKQETGGSANILVLGKEDLKEETLKKNIINFTGSQS